MRLRGPYVTLVAGLAAAAAIGAMSVNATDAAIEKAGNNQATGAGAPANPGTATPAPTGEPTPPPEATEAPAGKAVYAGRVKGATLAVSVKGDRAIAYLCDGRRVEAWMSGTVTGDQVVLKGPGSANAGLNGKITGNRMTGTVFVKQRTWDFDIKTVRKPSGLYQAAAIVRGARVVGSWIVLADGTQVGVVATDGRPAPAPRFDPDSGTAAVDGGNLIVMPVGPDGA
jgi:hypothetical protein